MSDSNVTIVGNMIRDPELRFSPSGAPILSFGVAVNRRWMNKQTQEWDEQVSFFNVTAFGQLAENIADSVQKGTRVIVTGRLEQRSFETKEGEKRSSVEIVVDDIGPSLKWATVDVQRNERHSGERQAPARSTPQDDSSEPF